MSLRDVASHVPDPFPAKRMVQLPCMVLSQQQTTNASAQVINRVTAYLNNVDDPAGAGTGDYQPYGYSACANIWQKYLVHYADVEAEFFDPSIDGLIVGIQIGGGDPNGLALRAMVTRPNTLVKTMSNSGEQRYTFKVRVPLWEILGLTKAQYIDQANVYGGTVGSAPSTTVPVYFWYTNEIAGAVLINFQLKITYHTQMYSRSSIAVSTHA